MSSYIKDFKKKRLRNFFLHFASKEEEGEKVEDKEKKLAREGLLYIQMKLPIKDITPEYEEKIKEDIHHKFIHAEIREATEEDLESILRIYNRSWLTSREPFSRLSVDSVRIIFEDQDTTMLIAKVYGMDAGFLITDFEGENKEYGVIAGLAVLPRFQRKGIGKILGMAAWNYFKERGIKELRCEVYVDNIVSYNFIKSLGFKEFDKKRYKEEDFQVEETS